MNSIVRYCVKASPDQRAVSDGDAAHVTRRRLYDGDRSRHREYGSDVRAR